MEGQEPGLKEPALRRKLQDFGIRPEGAVQNIGEARNKKSGRHALSPSKQPTEETTMDTATTAHETPAQASKEDETFSTWIRSMNNTSHKLDRTADALRAMADRIETKPTVVQTIGKTAIDVAKTTVAVACGLGVVKFVGWLFTPSLEPMPAAVKK